MPVITHEPIVPNNWPHGHVSVNLTDPDEDECFVVEIHGVFHYLHASTTRELSKMLLVKLNSWNQIAESAGLPGV